jgi:agmatine deiminase
VARSLNQQQASPTPRELGYRMPAEWERHAATWIGWPQNRTDWPGKFGPIPWAYAEIVRHLARVEDVNIVLRDAGVKKQALDVLRKSHADLKRVKFHIWPTNRGWTRDSGPIFIVKTAATGGSATDRIAAVNWRFNAWAKYSNWKHDNQLPDRICRKLKVKQFTPLIQRKGKAGRNGKPYHVVLEGGSIDVNGQGLMLTTEECLLSNVQQRNPELSQKDLEQIFADYLGIEKVIWLDQGIVGDDTHGHVDDISRFVSPDTVLTAVEPSRGDANYEPLQENLRRLRAATDAQGRKLQVVELPLPRPVIFDKQRLPASYANFYIANNLVLVPTFNDPNDRVALNAIAGLMPKHEVVGIYCGDFIWGLGAIHCATQQQPE